MGDSGSYFLGATLAGLLVLGQRSGIPLLLVGLASFGFLADAAGTLGFRLSRGHSPLQAHRSHLYQRLVDSGWSQARVSAVYMAFAAVTGALGLAILKRA
jgi:UDP-N-acetylmuramyl pentapeptide phosphotransferase/UDP-N-acetylglucosamine-1-phosphate transferase